MSVKNVMLIGADELGLGAYVINIKDDSIVQAEIMENRTLCIGCYDSGTTVIYVKNNYGETVEINVKIDPEYEIHLDYKRFERPVNFVNAVDYGLNTELEDNAPAIQAAINALPDGGVVYVPKGIYKTSFIQLKEGVTLKLEGILSDYNTPFNDEIAARINNGEFAVLQANLTYMFINHEAFGWGRTGVGNFGITGGVIDMVDRARAFIWSCADGVLLENVIMKDCPNNHAIQITGSKNVIIRNTMFAGYNLGQNIKTAEIIQIEEAQQVAIGTSKEGKNLSNYEAFEVYNTDNVLIESCYFGKSDKYGTPTYCTGHHGAVGKYCATGIRFKNCTYDNPRACALRIYGWQNVEITGCSFISDSDKDSVSDEHHMIEMSYPPEKDAQLPDGTFLVKGYERGGVDMVNIHDNRFYIGKNSRIKGIMKTLRSSDYGFDAKAESDLPVVDTYDSATYLFTGYRLVNHLISNIRFCNNHVTIENEVGSNYMSLSGIKGLSISGNMMEAAMTDVAESTSIEEYEKNYVVSATSANKTVPIILSGADTRIEAFCVAKDITEYHNLLIRCEEGGRIDRSLSGDGSLMLHAVAEDGYAFDGYYVDGVKLTEDIFYFKEESTVVAKLVYL